MKIGRGICSSFLLWLLTSRSEVVIKNSSNLKLFCSKLWNFQQNDVIFHSTLILNEKKMSFGDFLITTWEREVKSRKKRTTNSAPKIPPNFWTPCGHFGHSAPDAAIKSQFSAIELTWLGLLASLLHSILLYKDMFWQEYKQDLPLQLALDCYLPPTPTDFETFLRPHIQGSAFFLCQGYRDM